MGSHRGLNWFKEKATFIKVIGSSFSKLCAPSLIHLLLGSEVLFFCLLLMTSTGTRSRTEVKCNHCFFSGVMKHFFFLFDAVQSNSVPPQTSVPRPSLCLLNAKKLKVVTNISSSKWPRPHFLVAIQHRQNWQHTWFHIASERSFSGLNLHTTHAGKCQMVGIHVTISEK